MVKLSENSVNSKFIFLIRNPIDIAISRGLRKLDYKMQNKENVGLSDDEYLRKQATFTKNHFKRLFSEENNVGALLIKYEDLVENSNDVLQEIFSYIGIELNEEEIDKMLVEYSSASNITKNENRKAKPDLTESQKEILISELSETCEKLGMEFPHTLIRNFAIIVAISAAVTADGIVAILCGITCIKHFTKVTVFSISNAISEPPINSPWTNTWGIVGKSDQAHTEGIARGSLRMLTDAKGSPRLCKTCAARFEKPHCAAPGSPFMNKTIGCSSTIACNSSGVHSIFITPYSGVFVFA